MDPDDRGYVPSSKLGLYRWLTQAIADYGTPFRGKEAPPRLLELHARRNALAHEIAAEVSKHATPVAPDEPAKKSGWRPPPDPPARPRITAPPLPRIVVEFCDCYDDGVMCVLGPSCTIHRPSEDNDG